MPSTGAVVGPGAVVGVAITLVPAHQPWQGGGRRGRARVANVDRGTSRQRRHGLRWPAIVAQRLELWFNGLRRGADYVARADAKTGTARRVADQVMTAVGYVAGHVVAGAGCVAGDDVVVEGARCPGGDEHAAADHTRGTVRAQRVTEQQRIAAIEVDCSAVGGPDHAGGTGGA